MKKILLLGGSAQQVVAIETAKRMGYFTIVCDYLKDNPGQYVADKFFLESTTDKEIILEIARKENVDGILAYASDPAAPTAAYVAEKLGLPTNPYKSVDILCNKDKFRHFLKKTGFATPKSGAYGAVKDALEDIGSYNFPIIVKPVDSSGSKGVSVVKFIDNIKEVLEVAFSFSRSKRILIEEFIEKKHKYLIGGDIFVLDGNVVLWGLMNCHRDREVNELVPVGKSYPLDLESCEIEKVKNVLGQLVKELNFQNGAMNVELVIDTNNEVRLIDIGPRNGGNMIPDLLGYIFNIDIVEMTIKTAMGELIRCGELVGKGFYATHNLHSSQMGYFEGITLSEEIRRYIIKSYLYKNEGDIVEYFDNAAKAIGIIFMRFEEHETMMNILENVNCHINVDVKSIG